jgi:hypothetical protein
MTYRRLTPLAHLATCIAFLSSSAAATAQATGETRPVVLDTSCTFTTAWSVVVGSFPAEDPVLCALVSKLSGVRTGMSRREVIQHLADLPNGGDAGRWAYGFDVAGDRFRRWFRFRFIDEKVRVEEGFRCTRSATPNHDRSPASQPHIPLRADLAPQWFAEITCPDPGVGGVYGIPYAHVRVFDALISAIGRAATGTPRRTVVDLLAGLPTGADTTSWTYRLLIGDGCFDFYVEFSGGKVKTSAYTPIYPH